MSNRAPESPRTFPGKNIRELLEWPDGAAHERVAVTFAGVDLSYGDLDKESLELAAGLERMGVAPGDCVAAYMPNSLEIYQLYFATAAVRGIFLPINQSLSVPEVSYLLGHAKPTIVFTQNDRRPLVEESLARAGLEATVISVDERMPSGSRLSHLAVSGARPVAVSDAEDVVLISYTSGTTANPKAIAFSHRVEVNGARFYRDAWALAPDDLVLVCTSMGWTYGINPGSFPALRAGARILLQEKFHPVRVLEAMEAEGVTVMMGVPTMYGMMIEHVLETGRKYDLSRLRLALCAGAELSTALATKFEEVFGIILTNFLGMSEVKLVASPRVGATETVPLGSVGKPPPDVQVRIVDEQGNDVPTGVAGEILVKSPGWMTGYYLDPEKTRSVVRDGWFVSGDLGRFDENGFLYVVGRNRDQIIRGGAKVAPAEVEDALETHPCVVLSAVVGIPDLLYGEEIKAYVVTREPGVTAGVLQEHCRQRMASFKVPTVIEFVPDLPIGPTGKVLKKALRAR